MSVRFLGLADGRLSKALRAIHKLTALGFTEADIPELAAVYRGRLERKRTEPDTAEVAVDDGEARRQVAEEAIRTMMALGFSEAEIGALVSLDHATIAHLLNPYDARAISEKKTRQLREVLHHVGAERLSLLLPRIAINVLDTCHDKGRSLDEPTGQEIAKALRILILNALVLSSVPVPGVAGIHAFLAQIGDPDNFVYLFGALPPARPGSTSRPDTPTEKHAAPRRHTAEKARRLERLRLAEHEAEHLLQRFREQRQQLERDIQAQRDVDLPKDGSIA